MEDTVDMESTTGRTPTDDRLLLPGNTQRRPSVAFVLTHPIQYTVPFLRYLTAQGQIEIRAYYGSDHSIHGAFDRGYNRRVDWGVDLISGYSSEFLPVLIKGYGKRFLRPMIYGLRKRLKAQRPDVVWVSGYTRWISLYTMLAARSLGIPVYVESDSNKYDRRRSNLKLAIKAIYMKLVAALMDGCFNVGTWSREYWEQYLSHRTHDFVLFPHSVDNADFQQRASQAAPTREELRRQLDIPPGLPILLFVGRLSFVKGCDLLLRAHYLLLNRGLPPAYLVIVGDGPQMGELKASIGPEQAPYVRFPGFQDQVAVVRYYDLCDIFVLPSRFEPWGLVVNEAMNAAKPVVVSTRVGCGVDLVEDDVNGYRVPNEDPLALADALGKILADPWCQRAFSAASLEKINHWSYRERAEALLGVAVRARSSALGTARHD
jgi:glycosyltransferase involved in cell wall biosynthesis